MDFLGFIKVYECQKCKLWTRQIDELSTHHKLKHCEDEFLGFRTRWIR